jgi:hypothetical protein
MSGAGRSEGWNAARQTLEPFADLTNDGDEEGALFIDRLPLPDEAEPHPPLYRDRQKAGVERGARSEVARLRANALKLFPVMPWPDLAHLSSDDVQAIAAYLKSLPPVKNAVPGPFGPKDVPSTLVSVIVPGDVYAKMPAPK